MMANRSYLYGTQEGKHHSLSEYAGPVPHSFTLLVAYESEIIDSPIFENKWAIRGNFERGCNALFYLLDYLAATGQMVDQPAFEKLTAATKSYLKRIPLQYAVLDSNEYYALFKDDHGKPLGTEGFRTINEIAQQDSEWMGEDIENLQQMNIRPGSIFKITDEDFLDTYRWVLSLKENWKDTLALDAWRDILYYQFRPGDPGSRSQQPPN